MSDTTPAGHFDAWPHVSDGVAARAPPPSARQIATTPRAWAGRRTGIAHTIRRAARPCQWIFAPCFDACRVVFPSSRDAKSLDPERPAVIYAALPGAGPSVRTNT